MIDRPAALSGNRLMQQMRQSMQADLLSSGTIGKELLMDPISAGDSYRSPELQEAPEGREGKLSKQGKQLNDERRSSIPAIATIADVAPKLITEVNIDEESTTTKVKRRGSSTDLPSWWKARMAKSREKYLQDQAPASTSRRVSWHPTTVSLSPSSSTKSFRKPPRSNAKPRRHSMVVDVDKLHEGKYVAEKKQEVTTMRHRSLVVGQLQEISLAKPAGKECLTPTTVTGKASESDGNSMTPVLVGGVLVAVLIALDMTGTI